MSDERIASPWGIETSLNACMTSMADEVSAMDASEMSKKRARSLGLVGNSDSSFLQDQLHQVYKMLFKLR